MVRVLVTGGSGFVGQHVLARLSSIEGVELSFTYRGNLHQVPPSIQAIHADFSLGPSSLDFVRSLRPDVIVHCAALGNQTTCEKDPQLAHTQNTRVCEMLAEVCREIERGSEEGKGPLVVYTSTDMVYDGEHAPYAHGASACPVNEYGRSKAAGETALASYGHVIILRCALIYGSAGAATRVVVDGVLNEEKEGRTPVSFLQWMAPAIAKPTGAPLDLFQDEYRCGVYVNDIANCIAHWVLHPPPSPTLSVYNMGGPDRLSRIDMGCLVLDRLVSLGLAREREQGARITGVPQSSVTFAMKRPLDTSMDSGAVFRDCGVTPTRMVDALVAVIPDLTSVVE